MDLEEQNNKISGKNIKMKFIRHTRLSGISKLR